MASRREGERHPKGMDRGLHYRSGERHPSTMGWLLLSGIPPFGRILGSSILVVPLVTSKIIGLAGGK
jgi:hypothetical protein